MNKLLIVGGILSGLIVLRNIQYKLTKSKLSNVSYKVLKGKHDSKKRTLLLTGGLGFVGSTVVELLLKKGNVNITIFDLIAPKDTDRNDKIEYIVGNLGNYNHVNQALSRNIDSVLAIAASLGPIGTDEKELIETNVAGIQNIVKACKANSVKVLVFVSSIAAVLDRTRRKEMQNGNESNNPYPSKKENFYDVYGYSKYLGEKIVKEANEPGKFATISIRPGIIFGEKDGKLAQRLLKGLDNNIVGDGNHYNDYIDVHSVSNSLILAENKLSTNNLKFNNNIEPNGQSFFISSSNKVKVKDFFSNWSKEKTQPVPVPIVRIFQHLNIIIFTLFKYTPFGVWLHKDAVDILLTNFAYDSTKATTYFDYQPSNILEVKKNLIGKNN